MPRISRLSLTLVVFLLAGVAGNYFRLPVFLDIEYLFGSIFGMLALQTLGFLPAAVVTLVAASVTYLIWSHPYAIIILLLEVVAVHLIMRRWRLSMVLADALYWLFLGMPLVAVLYIGVMDVATTNGTAVMVKQALNGIANALLARLLFAAFSMVRGKKGLSLRELLHNVLVMSVMAPMLVMLVVDARSEFTAADAELRLDLSVLQEHAANRATVWFEDRRSTLAGVGALTQQRNPAQMQLTLDQLRATDLNWLQISVTDEAGVLVAESAPASAAGQASMDEKPADRLRTGTLLEQRQTLLSPVSISKDGTEQLVVSMVVPNLSGEGKYLGYTTGVLSLAPLRSLLDSEVLNRKQDYDLLDEAGRLILSNQKSQSPLQVLNRGGGTFTDVGAGLLQWTPTLKSGPALERWRSARYVREGTLDRLSQWRLVLEQPIGPTQQRLSKRFTNRMTALFVVLTVTLLVAELLSRLIMRAFDDLRRLTDDLPSRLAAGSAIEWPVSRLTETARLIRNFQAMAESLTARFEDIRKLNDTLEKRVNERTQSLDKLNRDFVALLDNTSDLIYFQDESGKLRFCSRALAQLLGQSDWRPLVGQALSDHLPPAAAQRLLQQDAEVLAHAQPLLNQPELLSSEHGEPAWFSFSRWPMTTSTGKVVGIYGIGRDITEQQRTDAELRVAAAAFEAQDGVLITDVKGVILRVNRAFTEITGYSADDSVGQTLRMLDAGRHDEAFFTAIWAAVHAKGSWQGEIWHRRRDGNVHPEWLTITGVRTADGTLQNFVATLTDISARKAAEEEIRSLAFYDPLTALPNRRLLLDRLRRALSNHGRTGRQGALLFIDLDHFKDLNDTLGHSMGDLLLKQVAQRLLSCVREGDTVARLGGDEFVVMLEDLSEQLSEAASQTRVVAEKVLNKLNQSYDLHGLAFHSTPSLGATLFAEPDNTVDELLKRADLAMYQAKEAGRNTLRFFDPQMQAEVTARAELEGELRAAVSRREFELHYQLQAESGGRFFGAEALVRWRHPSKGLIPPASFIALAEETQLILPLGHWVLETACAQLVRWAAEPHTSHLVLAVNVSARQFHQSDFVERVLGVLDATGANPRRLKLELTESLLVRDIESVIAKMGALKARGVGFSLDDFGTGYSSLSYLKRLPLEQLKIDRSFVRDVFSDPNDAAIVQTIIGLGQTMGLAVIAEGVETLEQRDLLERLGCRCFQGYLYGQPAPADALQARLLGIAS